MRKRNTKFDVTDFFCGCGGSSQGARQVLDKVGGEIKLALNHWKLAIETHNTNFPDTLHDCTDVSACDPRRYPSTLMAMFSPECTNHTLAKGKKAVKAQLDLYETGVLDPAAERSRATMWDVCRFAEYHEYQTIVVENVVDARKWVMYDSWIHAMHALGYDHKTIYYNSMHALPTPQSRDRMYVVFWKRKNNKPDLNFNPPAFCTKCAKDVLSVQSWKQGQKAYTYKKGYVYCCPSCSTIVEPYYYCAFNALDWSIRGERIGDRPLKQFFKKGVLQTYNGEDMLPLSPNTLRRIQYGIDKYGNQPVIVTSRYSTGIDFRVKAALETALPTQPGDASHALLLPFLTYLGQTHAGEKRSYPMDKPINTQSTRQDYMLVNFPFITYTDHSKSNKGNGCQPTSGADALRTQSTAQVAGLVMPPLMVNLKGTTPTDNALSEAIKTITGAGNHHWLLQLPFMVENKGESKARGSDQAASCVTTKPYHGIVTTENWNSFMGYYYGGSDVSSHPSEPINAIRTTEGQFLIKHKPDKIKMEDCYYRMIKSHEVGRAMAFEKDYIVLGNEREKVKQYGNAVTPPVMEMLMDRCVKSLQ